MDAPSAADIANLVTARSNLYAALASHGHKRSYSIDGQQVSYGDLWDRIKQLNEAIQQAQGPFELVDRGVT